VLRGVRAWEPLLMLGAEQVIDAARAWSHAAGAMEQLDIAQYGRLGGWRELRGVRWPGRLGCRA
jgi:hypothetical protein